MVSIDRLYGAARGLGGLSFREKETVMADKIQGEGNYDAARKFDKDERDFIKKGTVEQKAREAEQALDGPEGEDLERARKDSGAGKTH